MLAVLLAASLFLPAPRLALSPPAPASSAAVAPLPMPDELLVLVQSSGASERRRQSTNRKKTAPPPPPPPPPPPDEPGGCALDFHRGLQRLDETFSPRLRAARRLITPSDTSLPGRWVTLEAAGARSARRTNDAGSRPNDGAGRLVEAPRLTTQQGVCVRLERQKGGRLRCLKWVDHDAAARMLDTPPARPPLVVPLDKADRALVPALAELVAGRGLAPELGANGRLRSLVERVADEMRGFLNQPATAGLCNGVPEMLEFYRRQMSPQRPRARVVRALLQDAEALREQRFAAIPVTAELPAADPLHGLSAAADAAGSTSDHTRRQQIQAVLSWLGVAGSPNGLVRAGVPIPEALRIAVEVVNADHATIPAESESEDASLDRHAIALKALRAVEIAFYAHVLVSQHVTIEAGHVAVVEAIRAEHARACTCDID